MDEGITARLAAAQQRVKQKFPAIGKLPITVIPERGAGYAEYYPPDEAYNPKPGQHTIGVRRLDLPDNEIESIILGDSLHAAPKLIPEFKKLRDAFMQIMTPQQLGVIRDMHAQDKSPRTFEQFVDQSGADAFIRDYFFQKSGSIPGGKPFVEGVGPVMGAFSHDQLPILQEMERVLKSGGESPRLRVPPIQRNSAMD